jgi:hypothetical protein
VRNGLDITCHGRDAIWRQPEPIDFDARRSVAAVFHVCLEDLPLVRADRGSNRPERAVLRFCRRLRKHDRRTLRRSGLFD